MPSCYGVLELYSAWTDAVLGLSHDLDLNAGAANAGVPLAKIVQTYGWNAYFMSLMGACGIVLLLMAPMTRLDSYSQRMAKAELKAA